MPRKSNHTSESPSPEPATIAGGWGRYETTLNGNITRLPGVRRQIENAFYAGASEAVLLIGESPDNREVVKRLSDECRAARSA